MILSFDDAGPPVLDKLSVSLCFADDFFVSGAGMLPPNAVPMCIRFCIFEKVHFLGLN